MVINEGLIGHKDGNKKASLPTLLPLMGVRACTIVSTEVRVTGSVTYAAEAGAELGLPSCNALPALALALEMVLEAALLNKFLASTTVQIENGKKQQTHLEKKKTTGT